jgi:glutamate/tyrosine decarboxylase-like PLP-dependent enzyme
VLHGPDADVGDLPERAAAFIARRVAHSPLGRTATVEELHAGLRDSIVEAGLGVDEAWRRFTDVIVPATVGLDSERFLAFVPMSPSVAGVWIDAVVGAVSFSAESWLEAAGAVAAENQALDFLRGLAGMPEGSGGCFISGGSLGNLSALAVARERAGSRRTVLVADTAHASVHNSLHLLGLDALEVPTDRGGRLRGADAREVVGNRHDIGIVVAAGGSTNGGVVDDLAGVGELAADLGAWFHVDAAYGGAALLLPELRPLFDGIEHADSLIIDPHKWLFAPGGSCALLYRRPEEAAAVHTQHGPYIDLIHHDGHEWNPADYGYQLTRRASGMPLWFALALHGVEAHRVAVRRGVELAQAFAAAVAASDVAEMVLQPELGVVLFRRHGWGRDEWREWAARLLRDGIAFVAPSMWRGEPVGRLVFMHPRTPDSIVDEILATLAA